MSDPYRRAILEGLRIARGAIADRIRAARARRLQQAEKRNAAEHRERVKLAQRSMLEFLHNPPTALPDPMADVRAACCRIYWAAEQAGRVEELMERTRASEKIYERDFVRAAERSPAVTHGQG